MDVTALSALMEVLDQRQEAAERKRGEIYDREDWNQRSTPSTRRTPHGAPLARAQKMTMKDDPEGYLVTFEQLATATSWPREYWASRLGSCLIGEAQAAYQAMTEDEISKKGFPSRTLKDRQRNLEAVRKLRPANEVTVSVSSRTDSGVHALCNSAHVDIQRKSGKPPFTERLLVDALNYHLKPEPISYCKMDGKSEHNSLHTPDRKAPDSKEKQVETVEAGHSRSPDPQASLNLPNARLHRKENPVQRPLNFHLAPPNPPFPPHASRPPFRVHQQQQQAPQNHLPLQPGQVHQLTQQHSSQLSPAFQAGHNPPFFNPLPHRGLHSPNLEAMAPEQPAMVPEEMNNAVRPVPQLNAPQPPPAQPSRLNSFVEENSEAAALGEALDMQGVGTLEALSQQTRLHQWNEHNHFLQSNMAFPLHQQLAHPLAQQALRFPQQLIRGNWRLGNNAEEEPGPGYPRFPGLLREVPPSEQGELRDLPEMPPPQSRLLQYRQVQQVQPRNPGALPSPSSNSNHTGHFPGPYGDTNRELEMINSQAFQQHQAQMFNNAFPMAAGHTTPPPVKYLLPEAQWPHPGLQQNHILGQGFHYGMQQLAHRQEQVHLMQMHQQQQQQKQQQQQHQQQAINQESFHPLSPQTVSAASLHNIEEYEPRGPGRPLYQRRISSSSVQAFPEDSGAAPGGPGQCKELPDHRSNLSYNYPSPELWASANSSVPFQNIPCNGASRVVLHRDLLASKVVCSAEEHMKAEGVQQLSSSFNYTTLQHLGQFPPLMPSKQPSPEPCSSASGLQNPGMGKPPTMSYASALRAPPKPRPLPEQTKKSSDPLALLQELSIGSSTGSNGYYSYFK
ncbi:probable helicase with zinc finger domain [Polyodon spathula]|uniref:probable helicase with zinc finger domain n=1 Tax=Polyodon spathula TaxID=7913 RepID=UPI001B7DBEBE|nr:probable helicase with zinc finger domain [Polyodon spathula]